MKIKVINEGCIIRGVTKKDYTPVFYNRDTGEFGYDEMDATVYDNHDKAMYDFVDIKRPADVARIFIANY